MASTQAAFAVILAGGGGTRLWPASRRARPKQLLALGGRESLLAGAARRATAVVGPERTLVVTAADQEPQVQAALRAAGLSLGPGNVIAEPLPRNTAAAVGLGAVTAFRRGGPQAVIAVLPADPHIGDEREFERVLRLAIAEAAADAIVTIGLRPTHAETGFGYIRVGAAVAAGAGAAGAVHEVAAFVEKPDRRTAEGYVSSGEYLWNSGMFFLTAARMLAESQRLMPDLGALLADAAAAPTAAEAEALVRARYAGVPAISIDHGIMEKVGGLRVVPAAFGWNDVGSWAAVSTIRPLDARGNVVLGEATLIDGDGSVVVADEQAPWVGVLGVRDLVVVATRDAVLVIPKDRAQDVRQIVEAAKRAGRDDLL